MIKSTGQRSGDGRNRKRENARKIFERGARSGKRNVKWHSEGRVQEE
jgi:hypothetical protein